MKKYVPIFIVSILASCTLNTSNEAVLLKSKNDLPLSVLDVINDENYLSFLDKFESFSSSFSTDLYKENKDNFVISPLTLYFSLAMDSQCCNLKTLHEIESLLGINKSDIDTYTKYLYSQCNVSLNNYVQEVNNSIWINNNINVKDECLSELANNIYTDSYHVSTNSDAINEYIKEKTNGLIDEKIQLSSDYSILLMSTLYLYDSWNLSSNLKIIDNYSFTNQDGNKVSLQALEGEYKYGKIYKEEKFSHFYTSTSSGVKIKFIVPNDGYSLVDIDSSTIKKVNSSIDYVDEKYDYYTKCIFPQLELSTSVNLVSFLQEKYNVNNLFLDKSLSKLTDNNGKIDKFIHSNKLIFTNKGIEAGSVTFQDYIGSSNNENNKQIVYETFEVNKSFYFIVSDSQDLILYSGVVSTL